MRLIESIPSASSAWITLPFGVDAFLCRGRSDGRTALVSAGVHGDEYEGPAAVAELARRLRADAMRGSVIAIPVAHPAAFAAATRTSPEDGVNLARSFPGNAAGSPTERLAASLFAIVREVDYLVDLHSGGVEYVFTPLAGFYGGPGADNPSFAAACRFGLPALWRLPPTSGVLSYEAWRAGIPAMGMEYLGAGQLSQEGVCRYVSGVLSCLALWGICAGEALPAGAQEVFEADWILAPVEGLFHSHCTLGQHIEGGGVVADIRNPRGDVMECCAAGHSGKVLALRSKAYIRQGDWGVLIGTPA